MRILIVEDNKPQLELLHKLLEEEGFEVTGCEDGMTGLYELDTGAYDLAVLDRMLPELDGVSLLRRHRDNGGYTPVIMLTALSALGDRVAGLDAGADDYLAKPFAPEELLARIRALLRRPAAVKSTGFRQGDVELFRQRGVLKGPAGECTVSNREAALLYLFLNLLSIPHLRPVAAAAYGADGNAASHIGQPAADQIDEIVDVPLLHITVLAPDPHEDGFTV